MYYITEHDHDPSYFEPWGGAFNCWHELDGYAKELVYEFLDVWTYEAAENGHPLTETDIVTSSLRTGNSAQVWALTDKERSLTMKFYETFDAQGRTVIRMNRRNGRILVRWRNDMPGQTHYQWVRERKAVQDGYGDICYTAIQCAAYEHGLSYFSPARHMPELNIDYIIAY